MALPTEVFDPAISVIATYCATKVPSEHDDKLRIEYKVRGNTITVSNFDHRNEQYPQPDIIRTA